MVKHFLILTERGIILRNKNYSQFLPVSPAVATATEIAFIEQTNSKTTSAFLFYLCFQATGMTPLMYAVKDNRTSLVDRMIELGSDVGARNNVSKLITIE